MINTQSLEKQRYPQSGGNVVYLESGGKTIYPLSVDNMAYP